MARAIDIEIVLRNAANEPITEIFPDYAELSMETKIAIRMYAQYWKATLENAPTFQPAKNGNPLTLEELKQMAGQPVWVEVIDHKMFADKDDDFDGWGLVRSSWVRLWDESRADIVHVDYDFEEYGKTWRAYSKPVKHGKWEWNDHAIDWGLGAWVCSECHGRNENIRAGKSGNPNVWSGSKYCPNCGVRMEGEANGIA